MHKLDVMVVDHDPWTRLQIATALRETGVCVTEASNGASALRRAVASAPHVAILGRALPEIDAEQLTDNLRADPRTRQTAVVALTARVDADASLELPYSPIHVLATVVEALEARRQTLAATPIRSVIASAFGSWPLEAGGASRSTSRMRNGGRSGKLRLSNGIDTL